MLRTYKMPNAQPWTLKDEIHHRIGNVKRMLIFAWLAATYDSRVFSLVFLNCVREEGDGLIAIATKEGKLIDPYNIHERD